MRHAPGVPLAASTHVSRTTGNTALGGYFNDAFYLELLRTAHLVAVKAGVELTGAESMGLGGEIRSYDAIQVPEESAALDAKANEFWHSLVLPEKRLSIC